MLKVKIAHSVLFFVFLMLSNTIRHVRTSCQIRLQAAYFYKFQSNLPEPWLDPELLLFILGSSNLARTPLSPAPLTTTSAPTEARRLKFPFSLYLSLCSGLSVLPFLRNLLVNCGLSVMEEYPDKGLKDDSDLGSNGLVMLDKKLDPPNPALFTCELLAELFVDILESFQIFYLESGI